MAFSKSFDQRGENKTKRKDGDVKSPLQSQRQDTRDASVTKRAARARGKKQIPNPPKDGGFGMTDVVELGHGRGAD
jgi:hypothetical protein